MNYTLYFLIDKINANRPQSNRIFLRKDLQEIIGIPTTSQTFCFDPNFRAEDNQLFVENLLGQVLCQSGSKDTGYIIYQ